MSNRVTVYKRRANVKQVSLGFDVSADTFASDIRAAVSPSSLLIASWQVTFLTNGSDGLLVLRMSASVANQISADVGYMDIKRISGGQPLPTLARPLEVEFIGAVTP